jgi:uncharacterized membrane protein YraQ (UPF0718 family)
MLSLFTHLADYVAYDLFGLSAGTQGGEAVHFFIEDITKIFFLLVVVVFVVGFLRSWVNPDKVRHWLEGRSRFAAYFLAVLLGAVTPFCSCSSIPLFIAFLSSGIPLGVTMAFLITSPMVNEVAAVLFGEAIGWNFALSYVAVGMGAGMLGGVLIDALKLEKYVEPFACAVPQDMDRKMTLRSRVDFALAEVKSIVGKVGLYVLIGVWLGAVIHGYVPADWFLENVGAENFWSVPLAVLMGIPLYANVTGIVPVAESLIDKGLPVGTTLAFIMSTVGISLPEMIMLRRVLKPRLIAILVAYFFAAFTLVGYAFNAFF